MVVSPVAVTWKVPPVSTTTDVLFAEVIVGATLVIVRAKDCVAMDPTPLFAIMVKVCVPTVIVPGMVISPDVLLIVTPDGSPVKLKVGAGVPVATTWKVPPVPYGTDVLFAEVMVGWAATVRVKDCISVDVMLFALTVKLCVPTAVVPAMVISPDVPLMLTPAGAPVKLYMTGKVPVDVTWKVPPTPPTTDVLAAEVNVGAMDVFVTLRVKL